MPVKLTVLGVRGALPAAGREFLTFGGNTSCIAMDWGGGVLCFDAGSGLASLAPRTGRLDILISHVHLDHILGLVCLTGRRGVHLYGEARQGAGFRRQLEAVIGSPYWPVGLEGAQFHETAPGERFRLDGGPLVSAARGNHPDMSLLYRVDWAGKSVSYALDCEMSQDLFPRLTDFVRGSSLLVWDANFAPADKRPGWGHSTWEEGLAVARAAGVERILMTHYDRAYTDPFLEEQERLARLENSACIFAREGMEIEI